MVSSAQAEELQPGLEQQQRAVAEDEAAGPHGRVVHRDLVGVVEGAELAREFVEIGAEEVRAQVAARRRRARRGSATSLRARASSAGVSNGVAPASGAAVARRQAELAEDAVDAGDGVEQVGGGVAVERDHLVPRKHVVARAVLREVGVLHRADADDLRDGAALGLGQLGILLADQPVGALDRLGEEVLQADVLAAAGLEGLAVLAEHGAEIEVLEARTGRGRFFRTISAR